MKKIIKSTKFDDCECNFKLKSKGPQAPEWFKEFVDNQEKFNETIRDRLDKIDARLDEHDKMFRSHGWK